ncbi:MAG: monofunctional biosynthetic peptidoglycan transglycosylase [Candidatus Eisenbacteria bacterium]|uniref:Biosynthetic peptidoglycan transglycosylase n=1 Tax=Eiseniibacteriota bacterium TaxID=2212470 RepID=A0A538UCK5_UNCEI|nr:MAG: monofunctional biosynthetic peptidoglycan transglycosylase [Candidatus Eisenbacteria bacterium]
MTRVLIGVLALLLVLAGAAMVTRAGAALPDVTPLARRVPARTALMRQRLEEARVAGRSARVDQRWLPYESIPPVLRRAVLIAEDDAFFSHGGLDWNEIRASVRRNLEAGRLVRGGSTITQQLAKNLYLGSERTLTRKLREMMIAGRLERALTKRRIFELYLNLIEWGDGVYGIEAAAERHFGVPADALDARQAALLAAVIINPRRFDPAHPVRRIERRARMILTRMWRRGQLTEAEYRVATGQAPAAPAWEWNPFARHPDTTAPGPETTAAPPDSAAAADSLPH